MLIIFGRIPDKFLKVSKKKEFRTTLNINLGGDFVETNLSRIVNNLSC